MAEYKIYIRDKQRKRVAEVDNYANLQAVLRFNDVGTWTLTMEAGTTPANLLSWGGGIVLHRDGVAKFSGPVRKMERRWNANENVLIASGFSDEIYLNDRLAYPVPGGPPYTSQAYDVRTGAAETIMKQYVDYNAGPNANTERRVSGLTLQTDAGLGSSITGRARFQTLLELLQKLAIQGGGLGLRIVDLEFQVYQPEDKTGSIVLSKELGNLKEHYYHLQAATGNYGICGGDGEGVSRAFEEGGDSESIVRYGRIETFIDQRSTADSDELQQAVAEELEKNAEKMGLTLVPIVIPNMEFYEDYDLGDQVKVMVDGEAVTETIREAHLTLTSENVSITPFIGSEGVRMYEELAALFEVKRQLARRISNLERI